MIRSSLAAALLWVIAIGPGCASPQATVDNMLPVATAEYDAVFDATVATLRDYRFAIERQDRRFGVITTEPEPASSLAEPWLNDNVTLGQTLVNTANYRRRVVEVALKPAGEEQGRAEMRLPYTLGVVVRLQERQRPPRMLHTAAVASLDYSGRYTGHRSLTTEVGPQQTRWTDVGRDPQFEQHLIRQIIDRATRATAPADVDDDQMSGASDNRQAAKPPSRPVGR